LYITRKWGMIAIKSLISFKGEVAPFIKAFIGICYGT
jgi:hypothetical protein